MSHVVHRSLIAQPPTAVRAKGLYIEDTEGRQYIDASGGAAVSCLGHGHPDVLAAMHAQIDQLDYAHTGFFTTQAAEDLATFLAGKSPASMNYSYFLSGGSEAVEAALKIARQYFVEIGQPQRTTFIGRRQSYHGNTLGALAVGGNEWRRKQFAPLLVDVGRVSPCFEYRERLADETQEAYTQRLLAELEATIQQIGPDNVIGFCAETVVGATAGAVPPTPGYFKGVREICDRHGILLILDEVMSGMGRTGTLFAFEQEGVVPDIVTMAKGLGGGYQAIGAFMVQDKIAQSLREGSGLFQHGHTYMGHPVACAAALAVQQVIERDNLLANVVEQGQNLRQALEQRFGEHTHVGDIRGRGLFMAIELVKERQTKTPFEPSLKLHTLIKQAAMARGLMVYPSGGTIDGVHGDHVLVAPPFIVTKADVHEIVSRLGDAVNDALGQIGPAV
ncbi:aspartate aminotransferase family protein, partial [Orrella sp. 11846]|uniref:aspartate aminotransferase family protein n=1 Tax=Orrella sp. 11846 TaxID=3409913 RepID=UPI003B58F852